MSEEGTKGPPNNFIKRMNCMTNFASLFILITWLKLELGRLRPTGIQVVILLQNNKHILHNSNPSLELGRLRPRSVHQLEPWAPTFLGSKTTNYIIGRRPNYILWHFS